MWYTGVIIAITEALPRECMPSGQVGRPLTCLNFSMVRGKSIPKIESLLFYKAEGRLPTLTTNRWVWKAIWMTQSYRSCAREIIEGIWNQLLTHPNRDADLLDVVEEALANEIEQRFEVKGKNDIG